MGNNLASAKVKLTSFSHGAGCGCKISPEILDRMLLSAKHSMTFPQLLVGNSTKDDAAVYDMGNGTGIISTTDFFMPIVDDAFDFGRIASANAISDIYAMGGKPLMAIAVLGWPIDKIDPEVAGEVLKGSQAICEEAGIPLAGGHSIDSPEPIFGLAVTGVVPLTQLKQNNHAKAGDLLYLTKPIGIGILSTAQKKGWVTDEDLQTAIQWMTTLNKPGEVMGKLSYVHALTDVTGFGLLGHLSEICEGSGVQAEIDFHQVPVIPAAITYLEKNSIPGGTIRNWKSYGHKIGALTDHQKHILADPQTSGGLLASIDPHHAGAFEKEMESLQVKVYPIGRLKQYIVNQPLITIND
jgi:selenide,water dikinase